MRNQPKPLTIPEQTRQERVRAACLRAGDKPVRLYYTKRDGSTSRSEGVVKFFSGIPGMDTGSVTIEDPEKGNRTINLHRVFLIE